MTGTAPLFSIVTPVFDPPVQALTEMIDSVLAQTFLDWELVAVDDASTNPEVRMILRAAAARDERIIVVERESNGHIVAASNDAVARARGEFIALVDHDDQLAPTALERMRAAIHERPRADYLYSDEDKIGTDGRHYDHFRKPEWSPVLLRGQMYTGHLQVLRTSLVRDLGAFRPGFEGSQDHDLALRVTERAREIVHVPEVLYHWRVVPGSAAGDVDAKPYAWVAGRKAVDEHLQRLGVSAHAEYGDWASCYKVLYDPLPADLLVSIIIPTRGGTGYVWGSERVFVVEAVRSLVEFGGHENIEIVVVYDTPTPSDVLDELRRVAGDRLVLLEFTEPFNYSKKCNDGFVASHGEVIVMMNDDVELLEPGLIPRLVAPLSERGIGVTGARLLYADGTIQHAGLGVWTRYFCHPLRFTPGDEPGPNAVLKVSRETSAVTGACLALTRATYQAVGGFTERLPANFNDVDFSLKVRQLGLSAVWVHDATAYHFESQTRVVEVFDYEVDFMTDRWALPQSLDLYMPGILPG
ncbi:glycosyltransferase family 2 protein [Xylanimonas protaetiae]|uniref:Glycosyltransferase n=1 Tax=Xylanimonas protaetiae TaxID=2509457 RepID=A0A4P6F0C8_9MICO|nr:glycosyltransferase [Xylanimonas protaetiae]QAY68912.1 glycosyltransferase [Xylanimonas protaetiae]